VKKLMWMSCCVAAGLMSVSAVMASVPSRVTDDTAIYQNLSEIRVQRQKALNFDSDIARLSLLEGRYREKKLSQLRGPSERIAKQKYRYSGAVARK